MSGVILPVPHVPYGMYMENFTYKKQEKLEQKESSF
jgi:hypothetical protein